MHNSGYKGRGQSAAPHRGRLQPKSRSRDIAAGLDPGREDFLGVEGPTDGLGPAFNGRSCAECHSVPAIGGIGNQAATRTSVLTQGVFAEPTGGSLIPKFSNPDHRCQPLIPANASVVATRIPAAICGGHSR